MKNSFLTILLVLVMCQVMVAYGTYSNAPISTIGEVFNSQEMLSHHQCKHETFIAKKTYSGISRAQEPTLRVYLNYDEFSIPNSFQVFDLENMDIVESLGDAELALENPIEISIPEGTYDIMVSFIKQEEEGVANPGLYVIVKEDVKVIGFQEMSFDINEAQNRIQFKPFLPNGEEMRADVRTFYDESYTIENSEVIKGNIGIFFSFSNNVILEGFPSGRIMSYDFFFVDPENSSKQAPLLSWVDIYVNDNISSRYKFADYMSTFLDANNPYSALFMTEGSQNKILDLKPNKLIQKRINYTPSPIERSFIEISKNESCVGMEYNSLGDNKIMGTMGFVSATVVPNNYYNLIAGQNKETLAEESFNCTQIIRPSFIEGVSPTTYSPYGTTAPAFFPVGMGYNVVNYTNGFIRYEGDIYPDITCFSFDVDKIDVNLGDTAPIFKLVVGIFDFGQKVFNGLIGTSVGFLGEERNSDMQNINMEAYFNGSITDLSEINSGNYEIKVRNNNIIVDGMEGFNTTTYWFDTALSDFTPPTLTFFQMRNSNGEITNSFKDSTDANLLFAAGDISLNTETLAWEMKEVVSVSVECANIDSEEWSVLNVDEMPEFSSFQAFGNVYNVNLKDAELGQGWQKIRIKVVDSAGNIQEQIFGPVFYLDKASGLIQSAIENNFVEIYNMHGIRLKEPQTGLNIIKKPDGTISKYIRP